MVMPCCDRTYAKYMKDGNVDKEFVESEFGEAAKVEWRETTDTSSLELAKHFGHHVPKHCFVMVNGAEQKLCTCVCHEHSTNVMH